MLPGRTTRHSSMEADSRRHSRTTSTVTVLGSMVSALLGVHPEPVNVASFTNRDFAGIIKLDEVKLE